jgi:hypothetical protein
MERRSPLRPPPGDAAASFPRPAKANDCQAPSSPFPQAAPINQLTPFTVVAIQQPAQTRDMSCLQLLALIELSVEGRREEGERRREEGGEKRKKGGEKREKGGTVQISTCVQRHCRPGEEGRSKPCNKGHEALHLAPSQLLSGITLASTWLQAEQLLTRTIRAHYVYDTRHSTVCHTHSGFLQRHILIIDYIFLIVRSRLFLARSNPGING